MFFDAWLPMRMRRISTWSGVFPEQAEQLRLRGDLGGHQVEHGDPQRAGCPGGPRDSSVITKMFSSSRILRAGSSFGIFRGILVSL